MSKRRVQSGNKLTLPPTNPAKIAFELQERQVAIILEHPTPPPPPTNDHQVTFQDPHTITEDTLERLDSYLNKMSNAIANAATAGSIDATDISSKAKSLETLILSNETLVREVASLRAELSNNSSH